MDPAQDLGSKLRKRRKEQGLTLQHVAEAAGVTTGFVSQVERNIASPSLASLTAMAHALDAHVRDFFDPPPAPSEVSRGAARTSYAAPGGDFEFERLSTTFPGSNLTSLLVHLPPDYRLAENHHEGEEFHYVLAGSITLTIDGEPTVLTQGDSVHFASTRPHSTHNHTDETATVIICNTMHVFGEDDTND